MTHNHLVPGSNQGSENLVSHQVTSHNVFEDNYLEFKAANNLFSLKDGVMGNYGCLDYELQIFIYLETIFLEKISVDLMDCVFNRSSFKLYSVNNIKGEIQASYCNFF